DHPLPSYWNQIVFGFRDSVVIIGDMQGTGFLIGSKDRRRLILTCYHVVAGSAYKAKLRDEYLVQVCITGYGLCSGQILLADDERDVALIVVTTDCDGLPMIELPNLELSDRVVKKDMELVMLGNIFMPKGVIKEPGTSYGKSKASMYHNSLVGCDILPVSYVSTPGTSGAPVFLVQKGSSPEVIGMHAGRVQGTQYCIPMPVIEESLRQLSTKKGFSIPEMIEKILSAACRMK
ncbi:hypothetical protein CFC21_072439, partial [Triticum aestivum]